MKPRIILCLVVFTTTIFPSLQTFAQDISINTSNENRNSGQYSSTVKSVDVKDEYTSTLDLLKIYSPKVFKNFTRTYKGSTDIKVSQEKGETFIYCRNDGNINRIVYDKKGNWHHTIRYYDGSQLKPALSYLILNNYKGYELKNVTEVEYAGELAYFVSIECLRSWKVMRIQNDTMDEFESHQK